MKGHEIRQKFLDFFAERGHTIVPSSSLVPEDDPTLLFTNAGMNQFKKVFLGLETRPYKRAASCQKCMRAGGKHNDLENVGYTRRHHTFFEMFGNYSFGDYFKAEAIEFAWELVTKEFGLPKDRILITVFREDDEAAELWQKITGISAARIFRGDEKDNFWQMGDTGPCGPCSEIHFDLGPEAAEPGHEHEQFPSDCGGRYVELWNLVFMQYDRQPDGRLLPLPKPSIDTGMGLERIAAVLQGVLSNYDTDLLRPLVDRAGELLGFEYGSDPKVDVALRVAADHSRAITFLIHDGVYPSNEGRGYVLRKIIRRAIRHARRAGAKDHFLYKMVPAVVELMKPAYPELAESVDQVSRVVYEEELRYAASFSVAERIFQEEVEKVSAKGILPGEVVFKLYDTYGLPVDEQEEMAREFGVAIDRAGFEAEMQKQRERARASWKGTLVLTASPVYQELKEKYPTRFVGYERLRVEKATVVGLISDGQAVDEVLAGQEAELVLDVTPFYAESGGQVGDRGEIRSLQTGQRLAEVLTTYAPLRGLHVHLIKAHGKIRTGDVVIAQVYENLRRATMRNHTATHLLHASLRRVLGTHVKQAGSVVEPGRLRFDFTHYGAMTPAELREVEDLINSEILRNTAVLVDIMSLDEALAEGAMALFGEKYGERVRVVTVPRFSKELCGGTHVIQTGDIGLCKIVYEGSISAGVRRVEAITGDVALERYRNATETLRRAANLLRAGETDVVAHLERLLEERKSLEKELEQLKRRFAQARAEALEAQAREIGGVKVLAARVDGFDREQLRTVADVLRNKWKSGVLFLASPQDGNVALLAAVTKDLTQKIHAGKLLGELAREMGGKGGGRPDMAEGGARDLSRLGQVLEKFYSKLQEVL